jgi:hypothetical protein
LQHRSHREGTGNEPVPPSWEACDNRLSQSVVKDVCWDVVDSTSGKDEDNFRSSSTRSCGQNKWLYRWQSL